jgi:hypothetical protein
MSRLHIGILCAVVGVVGVVSWGLHHSAQLQLQERAAAASQQAALVARWRAENDALSNVLFQGRSAQFLSNDQIRELLRLRNQIGQRHRAEKEADELRATNQQLLSTLARTTTNENHWTHEPLAFAGFADAESALKSTLWIWVNGSRSTFLSSLAPTERAALERDWEQKTESAMEADSRLYASLYGSAAEGVCVMGKKLLSNDEAVIDIYFEGDGKTRKFVLKKFEESWKVTGLQMIFN